MDNMTFEKVGNDLVIKIDITKIRDVGNPKTLRIASSEGNQPTVTTPDGKVILVGLNAYVYRNKK